MKTKKCNLLTGTQARNQRDNGAIATPQNVQKTFICEVKQVTIIPPPSENSTTTNYNHFSPSQKYQLVTALPVHTSSRLDILTLALCRFQLLEGKRNQTKYSATWRLKTWSIYFQQGDQPQRGMRPHSPLATTLRTNYKILSSKITQFLIAGIQLCQYRAFVEQQKT